MRTAFNDRIRMQGYGPFGGCSNRRSDAPDGVRALRTRRHLLAARVLQKVGIAANDAGLRDSIRALRALPPGHPMEALLRESPIFSMRLPLPMSPASPGPGLLCPAIVRLHREGRADVRAVDKASSLFSHCGVMATIPQAARMARLSLAEQYAAIELFRGTMARHSVIAYRDDGVCARRQVSFTGDAWLGYVPIRMPETLCVQERLPGNAAAVLINRSHTYRDLVLPINATEKRLFDAVTGKQHSRTAAATLSTRVGPRLF